MTTSARDILDSRLATGEIGETEYSRLRGLMTDQAPASAKASPRRGFYFHRLWRGQISLASTCWLWGGLATGALADVARGLYPMTLTWWETVSIPVGLLGWVTFMLVAVLRSANRYQRKRPGQPWGRLAQCLWVLGYGVTLANWLPLIPGIADDAALTEQVARERELVGKVTNQARQDWVMKEGRTLDFGITVFGDARTITATSVSKRLLEIACSSPDMRHLLYRADALHYTYLDLSGVRLASVSIRRTDCAA